MKQKNLTREDIKKILLPYKKGVFVELVEDLEKSNTNFTNNFLDKGIIFEKWLHFHFQHEIEMESEKGRILKKMHFSIFKDYPKYQPNKKRFEQERLEKVIKGA